MNKCTVYLMLLPALVSGSALAASASTSIVLDGSLAVSTQQLKLDGHTTTIDGKVNGQISGSNLFFSFKEFSLAAGDAAKFQCGECNVPLANVISRVTGTGASDIDGKITSQIGNADFWFINPHGVVIGSTGQISVPAALHIGAVDSVLFNNGAYSASKPDDSVGSLLVISSPQSFGYVAAPGYSGNLEISGTLKSTNDGAIELVASNNLVNHASLTGSVKAGNDVENQSQGNINGRVEAGNNIQNSGTLVFGNTDGGLLLSAGNNIVNTGTLQIDADVKGTVKIVAGNSLNFNNSGVLVKNSVADLDITAPIVSIGDANSPNYYAISNGDNGAAPGSLLFHSGQKNASANNSDVNSVDGEFYLTNARIYSGVSVKADQYYTKFVNSGIRSGQSISIDTTNYSGFIPTVDTNLGSSGRSAVFLDSPDTRVNNVSTNGANQSVLPTGIPLPFVLPNGDLRPDEDPCSNREESSKFNKNMNKLGNYSPEIGAQTFSSILSSIVESDKTLSAGNTELYPSTEGGSEAVAVGVEEHVKGGC